MTVPRILAFSIAISSFAAFGVSFAQEPSSLSESDEAAAEVSEASEAGETAETAQVDAVEEEDEAENHQVTQEADDIEDIDETSGRYATDPQVLDARRVIARIVVRGNVRVEDEAVKEAMASRVGIVPTEAMVADDIRNIYDLGYFSGVEIRTEKNHQGQGWTLVVKVVEKPAISKISFEGFGRVSSSDVEDKLQMKKHKIVSESLIAMDVELIESMHKKKGYYLARGSYEIRQRDGEAELIYKVDPGHKVFVGNVQIVGNESFSESFLLSMMQTQPFSQLRSLFGSMSYNEFVVEQDQGLLSYLYQDRGFAKVKVARPITVLSRDQQYMDITFEVEEGKRYRLGKLDFSGDLLFDKDQLTDRILSKEGDYFRISQLRESIDLVSHKYGDLGYAFVDVSPDISFDDTQLKADIDFQITKGKKAYFGDFVIKGNAKTRDNIIRRELVVAAGDLFSKTGLKQSQRNIESLGFFDSVKFIRKIDDRFGDVVHYTIEVEEKSTGQIQGSLGYTPSGYTDANWFGQGRYEEKNQLGRAYVFDLAATYSNQNNYSAKAYFSNPRIYDSQWFFGANAAYTVQNVISLGFDLDEKRLSSGIHTGRTIWEKIRGSAGIEFARTQQSSVLYLSEALRLSGDTIGLTVSVSRRDFNSYIDPTKGTLISLSQTWIGGPLGGDYSMQERKAEAMFYYPVRFAENFSTYFKWRLEMAGLTAFAGSQPPLFKRYRLGGAFNLRGYAPNSITPRFVFWKSPFDYDQLSYYPKGGNRKVVLQGEYYLPLIPQAKMKALVFFDSGRVFDNDQQWSLRDFYSDVGFGVRWVTPMGPLRFEWAFPIQENGTLGPYRLVFNIGY